MRTSSGTRIGPVAHVEAWVQPRRRDGLGFPAQACWPGDPGLSLRVCTCKMGLMIRLIERWG